MDQIEKNTEVPYTIYGSANRLLPKFRHKLEKNPKVRICPCKSFDEVADWTNKDLLAWRSKYEHSFYLEQLIETAIEDGVTHVAVLHVDSFPIRHGWVTELDGKLSDTCVLAAIMRDEKVDKKPLTACMLFHRDFYLTYHPRLLPSEQELSSPEYGQYLRKFPHKSDSGCGYGFKIFLEGLSWYPLLRSNRGGQHSLFAGVYDDLIFHLYVAAYVDAVGSVGFSNRPCLKSYLRNSTKTLMAILFPDTISRRIKKLIPERVRRLDHHQDKIDWEYERQRLLADPESYIRYLRTGQM